MAYPFLSDDWVDEARRIRAEYRGTTPPLGATVKMNLLVNDVPFGDGVLDAHVDTSSGELELDRGHLVDPDLTITVDYATAKAMLIEGNVQAGMQAFMQGKVRIEGDMAKLMTLQGSPADTSAQEMAERLRDITE